MAYCRNCGSHLTSSYCPDCGTRADGQLPSSIDWEVKAKRLVLRLGEAIDVVQKAAIAPTATKMTGPPSATVNVAAGPDDRPESRDSIADPVLCSTLAETRADQRLLVPLLAVICVGAVLFTCFFPNPFMIMIDLGAIWGTLTFANSAKVVQPKDLRVDITDPTETLLHAHTASVRGIGLVVDSFVLLRLTERRLLLGGVGKTEDFLLEDIRKVVAFANDGIKIKTVDGTRVKLMIPTRVRDRFVNSLRQYATNCRT
jgi:hypothetical protein